MPNFKGNQKIQLQPYDYAINYEFEITVCSSSTANDGYISYGRTVSSVAVSGYAEDKTTLANDLIASTPSVNQNIITVPLSYPTISGEGRYNLKFQLTLDNGSRVEADFNRVQAEDL
jgi:hypothetical protein